MFMHLSRCAKHTVPAALVLAFTALIPAAALAQSDDEVWQWRATVYAYLPSMSGSTKIPGNGGGSVTTDQILDALDMAFMGQLEARKGRWGAFTDYIYLKLSDDKTVDLPLGSDRAIKSDMNLKGQSWTLAGTYTLVDKPGYVMSLLGGFRYLGLDTDITLTLQTPLASPISRSDDMDTWDAIVGVRGRANLGQGKWFLPYYLDVGAGDSKLTWQAAAGVGYHFNWGDLTAVYRHLDYDFESDSFIQDLDFSGPAIAASFNW